jgi:hypothetical protein
MDNHTSAFHVTEYASIKAEISGNISKIYNLIFYLMGANAFILTWSVQQHALDGQADIVIKVASWMPVILTGSAYLLYLSLRNRNSMLFGYCGKLEQALASSGLGWESSYRASGRKKFFLNSYVVFNVVFLVQLALALYYAYLVNFVR